MKHVFGLEYFVKLFLGEEFVLKDELVDAATGFAGLFGNLGGLLLADDWVEHSDDADAVLYQLAAALFVGYDAVDAEGA